MILARFVYILYMKVGKNQNPSIFLGYLLELTIKISGDLDFFLRNLAILGPFFP